MYALGSGIMGDSEYLHETSALITTSQCIYNASSGWLGRAMVLCSFQCRGVMLLWHMVGQGPALLAAGAG